jgi:hypothetical protein
MGILASRSVRVWTGDRSDGVAAQQSIRFKVWAVAWWLGVSGGANSVLS